MNDKPTTPLTDDARTAAFEGDYENKLDKEALEKAYQDDDDTPNTGKRTGLDNVLGVAALMNAANTMSQFGPSLQRSSPYSGKDKATLHRRDKNRMASKTRKAQRKPKKNRRKK